MNPEPHAAANAAHVHHDCSFVYLQLYSANDQGALRLCAIAMRPELAKQLHAILGEQIARYEAKHGEVPASILHPKALHQ